MTDAPAMQASERVALVTGAARGLGAAIAARLARAGHPVVLADVLEQVEAVTGRLTEDGYHARAVRLDVSDEAAVDALPSGSGEWWPRLASAGQQRRHLAQGRGEQAARHARCQSRSGTASWP